jgi:hypothetical protein
MEVAAGLEDELERRRQYRGSLVEWHPDGSTGVLGTRKVGSSLAGAGSSACAVAGYDPREVSGVLLLSGE